MGRFSTYLYGVGSGGPGNVTVTNGAAGRYIGPNSAWLLMASSLI